MIDAQGNLRFTSKTYRQILEQIANPKAVFTLHVSDAPNEKVLYFVNGGVRLLSYGERRGDDVESYLLKTGRLDIDALHGVLEKTRKNRKSLKEALIESKLLTTEEYSEIVNTLIRAELFDLVFWDDAYFTCYTGSPPNEIYDSENKALVGSPDCSQLEDEISEWAKQWERQRSRLYSDRAVVCATSKGRFGIEKLESERKRVLECALHPVELRNLWRTSGIELPFLCDTLVELIDKKWVAVEAPPREEETLEHRIALLEECLPRVLGKDLVREKLVACYRKAELSEKAVETLEQLAVSALRNAQLPLAIERYKKILSIDPANLAVVERLLKAYLDNQQDKEAVTAANSHAQYLLESGDSSGAKAVAKLLKKMTGSNLEAQGILAAVSAGTGDQQHAIDQYLSIAEEYEREGDKKQAIRILRQALNSCPSSEKILARLEILDAKGTAAIREKMRRAQESGGAASAGAARGGFVGSGASKGLLVALAAACVLAVLHASGVLHVGSAGAAAGTDGEEAPGNPLAVIAKSLEHVGKPAPVEGRPGVDPRAFAALGEGGGSGSNYSFGIYDSSPSDGDPSGGTDVDAVGKTRSEAPRSIDLQTARPRVVDTYRSDDRTATGGNRPSGGSGGSPRVGAPAPSIEGLTRVEAPRVSAPSTGPAGGDLVLPLEREPPPVPIAPAEDDDQPSPWRFQSLPYQPKSDWGVPLTTREQALLERVEKQAAWEVAGDDPDIRVVLRTVEENLLVAYADSRPLVGYHPRSGKKLFELTAYPDSRWSVGHRGLRICRWRAGTRGLLFNSVNRTQHTTPWRFPRGTDAVAISPEAVAIRDGETTTLYDLDGTPVRSGQLPIWEAGVFFDEWLILSRSARGHGTGRHLWFVQVAGWHGLLHIDESLTVR